MLGKKRTVLFTAIGIFTVQLQALPIGNPLDATWFKTGIFWEEEDCNEEEGEEEEVATCLSLCDAWSIRIGYYGDFVFNRRLRTDQSYVEASLRKVSLYTQAGFLAFNMWDKLEAFATLGSTNLVVQTPVSAFPQFGTVTNHQLNLEYGGHFSWSLGLRGTLWECGRFGLGAEGQYFEYTSDLKHADLAENSPFYFFDTKMCYQEYQLGLGATYVIPICGCDTFVVPYAGIKWSGARVNFGDLLLNLETGSTLIPTIVQLTNLKSQRHFGWAVGLTLVGSNRWSITAETRFFDESALYINSQMRL